MKKIITLGIIFLLIGTASTSVFATYWCGDGICEADYCWSDCEVWVGEYCGDLIEPWECDDLCGSELGWIRPFDCSDYGYTPTEDCEVLVDEDWCRDTYGLIDSDECEDGGSSGDCRIDHILESDLNEWCFSEGYLQDSTNEDGNINFNLIKEYWLIFLIIGGLIVYLYKKDKRRGK